MSILVLFHKLKWKISNQRIMKILPLWKKVKKKKMLQFLLKQHRIDKFTPSETEKKFLGRKKIKMTIYITTESPNRYSHKAIFSKIPFWGDFQIFKIEFFCHFWFSIKTKFFLNYKLTFVFPKKFLHYSITNTTGNFFFGGEGGSKIFKTHCFRVTGSNILVVKNTVFWPQKIFLKEIPLFDQWL